MKEMRDWELPPLELHARDGAARLEGFKRKPIVYLLLHLALALEFGGVGFKRQHQRVLQGSNCCSGGADGQFLKRLRASAFPSTTFVNH